MASFNQFTEPSQNQISNSSIPPVNTPKMPARATIYHPLPLATAQHGKKEEIQRMKKGRERKKPSSHHHQQRRCSAPPHLLCRAFNPGVNP
jgi:hypothetical protein